VHAASPGATWAKTDENGSEATTAMTAAPAGTGKRMAASGADCSAA